MTNIHDTGLEPAIDVPAGTSTNGAFDARKHTVRTGRSRKGRTTQTVTRYGNPLIVGSWTMDSTGALTPQHAHHLAEMTGARRGAFGWHALDVYTVTQAAFGNDPELEPLLGTDVRAFAQITPARTGVKHDRHADGSPDYGDWSSADECNVARHRSHLLSEAPHCASTALTTNQAGSAPGSVKAWPTRFKIKRQHGRRIGDPTDRTETMANGYHLTERQHLTSPSDDRETVFVGWRKVQRPEPRNGVTIGKARKRQTVARRTVDHLTADTFAGLCELFAKVQRGQRVTWQCRHLSGTMTVAADGRYSLSTEHGPLVKSVRTLLAVERKLEHAA